MYDELSSTFVPTPITQKQWQEKYWFTSLQMVTVINPAWYREGGSGEPTSHDYPFMVEMRHFIIRAGQQERLPGVIANIYLDQMSKILAQNDDKLSYMTDPALMKLYYDKLIVDVEDLAPHYDPVPSYLRNVAPSVVGQSQEEIAPWEQNMERARTVAAPLPQSPPPETLSAPASPAASAEAEPTERQFDVQGNLYKMITNKNGNKQFYKNGVYCSSAEYNKAASML